MKFSYGWPTSLAVVNEPDHPYCRAIIDACDGVRYHPLKTPIAVALSLPLLFAWPSSAQISTQAPSSAESGRIQNIAPEEMWKRVTQCVFPTYPGLAFDSRIAGAVDIGLGISPEGEVANYRVLVGRPLLVQSAVDAIRQWKFRPNVVQGEVTWSRVRALVRFNGDGTTAVDLAPAILADNFGDPGTTRSAAKEFPRPASSPECKSVQPWTGAEPKETWITSSVAQSAGTDFDAALGQLAFQIAGPLEKERVKRVIVADLLDANGRSHPVGRFLADRLSAVLLRDYPTLETISFSHSQSILDDSVPRDPVQASEETRKWAKKLGAKVVIMGSFAKALEGIGISLTAMKTSSGQRYAQTSGVVPISEEINSVSPEEIPSPKDGIARAGVGGVTVPVCLYCPIPEFSDEARAAKYQGTVVLQVVVTTEGRAANITVVKGPGKGLEEKAIEAVRGWKFRPAVGPDGHAVATLVPIMVTFRFSR
jgi:TonB family protein